MRIVSTDSFFRVANPRLVALITSGSDENANAMAATWHSPISFDPPLYGVSIAPKRATHSLIREERSFGINFLPFDLLDSIHTCGRISRRDRKDKMSIAGIEFFKGPKLGVPLVKEAYVAMECELFDEIELGDHAWFVGRVRSVLAGAVRNGLIDISRIRPTLYLGNDFYLTVDPKSLRRGTVKSRNGEK